MAAGKDQRTVSTGTCCGAVGAADHADACSSTARPGRQDARDDGWSALAVAQVVAIARALNDPIRVRMLGLMARGRHCCDLPDCSLPAPAAELTANGICVCEFAAYYQLGQSKVSYHLRILKEAGLVHEEIRGKWNFYSLNRKAMRQLLSQMGRLIDQEGEGSQ